METRKIALIFGDHVVDQNCWALMLTIFSLNHVLDCYMCNFKLIFLEYSVLFYLENSKEYDKINAIKKIKIKPPICKWGWFWFLTTRHNQYGLMFRNNAKKFLEPIDFKNVKSLIIGHNWNRLYINI